jgi:uncharacterized protein (TIGR02118 family)
VVKAFWFLKRRPEMSLDDFHRYWREQHGPLFCNAAPAQRYVTRYEQNHAAPENHALSGDDYEEYDGVSIMWFRSVEDMQAMFADPALAPVLEDGDQFLDVTATKQIVTFAEEPFALGSAAQS